MSLLNLINVAVGLILVWLLLSLVVMQIQEWLVGRYRLRSRMLAAAIQNMLGSTLAGQFYDHPIVRSLSAGKAGAAQPSYIPSEQFAAVVLDLIQAMGTEPAFLHQQVLNLCSTLEKKKQSKARKAALPRLRTLLNLVQGSASGKSPAASVQPGSEWAFTELQKIAVEFPAVALDIQVLEQAHRRVAETFGPDRPRTSTAEGLIHKTRAGLAALGALDAALAKSLRVVFAGLDQYASQPENGLSQSRQSLQNWFDSAMERLNGRYKRRAVSFSFLIGFGLAALINIDSVVLGGFLWRQAYIANALANQAQSLLTAAAQDPGQLNALGQLAAFQSHLVDYNLPVGWIGLPVAPDASLSLNGLRQLCSLTSESASAIRGLSVAGQCFPLINSPRFSDYLGWALKLLGWLVTGAAAAQGAPFWFDILARLINVRSSGIKPSPAAERVG
jgi:hypothetical protein